jgi:hypothetical protein
MSAPEAERTNDVFVRSVASITVGILIKFAALRL